MTQHARSVMALSFGAGMISFSPVFVLLAMPDVGPTAIGFWRTLTGGVLLLAVALVINRKLALPSRTMKYAILAGFFFCIDLYVWHRSILYVGAGMSTILGNTQVFATTIFSYILFKERVSARFVIAAVAAFGGVGLLVGVGSDAVEFSPDYIRGVAFGLATGLVYASYLMSLKKGVSDRLNPDQVFLFMAWTSLFSAFFLGLVTLSESEPAIPLAAQSILALIGLGVVVQAAGWYTITKVISRVKTAQAGLVLLLQPTLAMVWGVLFFAESLQTGQIVGAVVTLAAIYVGSSKK